MVVEIYILETHVNAHLVTLMIISKIIGENEIKTLHVIILIVNFIAKKQSFIDIYNSVPKYMYTRMIQYKKSTALSLHISYTFHTENTSSINNN